MGKMTTNLPTGLPLAPLGLSQSSLQDVPSVGFTNFDRSAAVPRFEEALRNASALQPVEGVRMAQLATTPSPTATDAVQGVQETGAADARNRAAEGLELRNPDQSNRAENSGATILNGLEQLRGAFDKNFTSVSDRIQGTEMNVASMIALQAEVVKFSVLVDVSSKLAGKSTQAMDSLMKGQ